MGKRILTLKKPVKFEGKDYKDIDLSALDDLRAVDLIDAQRMLENNGVNTTVPEVDHGYCIFLAARATKQPIELFLTLSAPDGTALRGVVSNFLFGEG